ncbi:MAG: hypothetical protein RL481_989, partial [Pseudomonadota bacterium]
RALGAPLISLLMRKALLPIPDIEGNSARVIVVFHTNI